MVIYKNKFYVKSPDYPNTDFIGNADHVVPDDSELAEKIISLYPNFDFVLDENGKIADVIETEHEAVPVPPTNAELAAAIAELAGVIMNG